MREIVTGIWHWTTFHDGAGVDVSSYYIEPAGVLIDPMTPNGGVEALAGRGRPRQIALTSGNHTRHADRFAKAFYCPIVVSREGAERIGATLEVEIYTPSDEIAPGVTALKIGVLSPDEYALHIDVGGGAIAFADGLNHYGGSLGFFADDLLGDDPHRVKEGLKERFRGLLERDFEHLLFAHGEPIAGHGKAALRDFATSPAGQEDYGQTA